MKPLSPPLQNLWDTAVDTRYMHNCEHWHHCSSMAYGAWLFSHRNEERLIAWNIYMICLNAVIDCLEQRNENIVNGLSEIS